MVIFLIENWFWTINAPIVDKNLIFRDKSTDEILVFDKWGYWDKDGLNHVLLN